LTSDQAKDREPRWASDSETIFFFSDRTGRYEVWSIRLDGSSLRQITSTEGRNVAVPVPSPDGTHLIVTGLGGPTSSGLIDLTKSLPTGEIEWLAPIDSTLSFWAAEWSPDGYRISGIARPDGGTYIYSFQEKWYQKISDKELDGEWLDDHSLLVIADSKILTIDIDTQEEREIYTIPEGREIGYWALSHDRRWIYYIETKIESDIWMLELGEREAL
jgi:WD40 repeat protein